MCLFLFRFSHEVSIGDEVLVSGGSDLTVAKVVNTNTFPMKGKFKFFTPFCDIFNLDTTVECKHFHFKWLSYGFKVLFHLGAYVPLTMEGNILVDGVLASCYPSAAHDLAHMGMAPLRWFPGIMDWILGVENTFPVYVKIFWTSWQYYDAI